MTAPKLVGSEGAGVDMQNPWPGLAEFAEEDAFFFHGREQEATELFRLVERERLTLLFSRSGLGKTSLLRAGLFPRLRPADYLPPYIRLDHSEVAEPLAQQIKTVIAEGISARVFDALPPAHEQTLWEYFHQKDADFWNEKNRPVTPVLAFDQFEEIFTLGRINEACRVRSEALLVDLADLIENRPSAALKEKLESGKADVGRFSFDDSVCKI